VTGETYWGRSKEEEGKGEFREEAKLGGPEKIRGKGKRAGTRNGRRYLIWEKYILIVAMGVSYIGGNWGKIERGKDRGTKYYKIGKQT